jgi:hypothetical protein
MTTIEDRLAVLQVPADWKLADWLEYEKDRLVSQFPHIKESEQTSEVSYELAAMLRTADEHARTWEARRQLVRVRIREEIGWAKRAVTADGRPVAERRIYDVEAHRVDDYHVDAIFGLRL